MGAKFGAKPIFGHSPKMKLFELATIHCDEKGCEAHGQVLVTVLDGVAWFPEHPGGWLITDKQDYCPKHVPKEKVEEVGA